MNRLVAGTVVLSVLVGWALACVVGAIALQAQGYQHELVELSLRVGEPMFDLYWFLLLPAFGLYSELAIRFVLRRGRGVAWIVPAIPCAGAIAVSAAFWMSEGRFSVYGSGLCVATLSLAVGATDVALGLLRDRSAESRFA